YARILLAAVSFWLMPTRPGPAAACYGAAALLDAVDGHAARALGQVPNWECPSLPLLFALCAGNEGFHCCLYLLHWGEGPAAFSGF
uniref:CDP-diacylglycerol--inositol 3-phosphatidyltransferase-like n=1 Tax=Lonchura striata TaxID=40157 RepID=UPI000B4C7951